MNMLHFGHDYVSNAGNYETVWHEIRVKYEGDEAFTSVHLANAAFTEAHLAQAWQASARDGVGNYSIAHTSSQYYGRTGSSGNYSSAVATGNRYLWEFTEDLALNGSKVLEQIEVQVYSYRAVTGNAAHGVSIFGINVTPIPEPGSVAMLGLGGVALLLRRRRRS